VIVEQYASKLLAAANRAYLLTRGEVQWAGPASEVKADAISSAYLGKDGIAESDTEGDRA
jgi:ABC-type branched-subunit amino acid transport system ATPase component